MNQVDLDRPFVIHLGVGDGELAQAEDDARARGMSVFRLRLGELSTQEELVEYLVRQFMFPYPVTQFDAVISLMADLEWFGNSEGYLVVVHLRDGSDVGNMFVSLLPNVVDRWRGQPAPFVVAIDSKGAGLQASIAAANAEMARSGELPWAQPGTGSVNVVVHDAPESEADK